MKAPLWLDLVEQYLAYRRSLGFILSADEQRLRQFAKFANRIDQQEYLTVTAR